MKKIFLPLLALFIVPTLGNNFIEAKADGYYLEYNSDYFLVNETSFAEDESFVITSQANFVSGQACGIVFGASQDEHYWVFNIDRYENRTKLLYFSVTEGVTTATELLSEYFIGNDKVTQSELNLIKPRVRENNIYDFKVVLSVEGEHVYGEFFIDNIKRFGVDTDIDLNALNENITYTGGNLGYNVFNAKVNFINENIGKSDYAYYTELYRNQYHYSQFSHWNNDPNGLVYYNGWYHLYYQTNPYSKFWGDMYWGHARSQDLIHWEELPYALFPDDGTMGMGLGNGYAWSGSAMVYRKGMSDVIDGYNWFPNGNGEGLIGFYTRDGAKQDQVIISSDDGGYTWVKRILLSQDLVYAGDKISCRDPSIFPVTKSGDKVTLWGMIVAGAESNDYWFLKSNDLVNWSLAGQGKCPYPECLTVSTLNTSDGLTHSVITVSSRYYVVGDFSYDGTNINFTLVSGRKLENAISEDYQTMDYGDDSYAAQCFYIDDASSKYYGKRISLSWYQGLPSDAESGLYAEVRTTWNGSGMTIPVELGLAKENDRYILTQKPITIDNDDLSKTNVVNVIGEQFNNESNILSEVASQNSEIIASFTNENSESIEFRINESDDEYTSFGWNKDEGYYVDRSHTSDAGLSFNKNYHHRFSTGSCDLNNQTFYCLVDNGGFELFVGDYKYAFYNLTLSQPYSINASIRTSGNVLINNLTINQIASIWHDENELDKGVLYLNKDNLELDLNLLDEKEIICYSSNGSEINYEIESGVDVIDITPTNKGLIVKAKQNGVAKINVISDGNNKTITVTVDNGIIDSDLSFNKENVVSGNWRTTSNGLVGNQPSGDGFIISNNNEKNFTLSAAFNISNAVAGGVLLHASLDMSSYIMCNYDKAGNICKIWSQDREIARASVNPIDSSNASLMVKVNDNNIKLLLNGLVVIDTLLEDSDPQEGYIGLNVCAGTIIYKNISFIKENYVFNNEDLIIKSSVEQRVNSIINITKNNQRISEQYYEINGRNITISKQYFLTLSEETTYSLLINGESSKFIFTVQINNLDDIALEDVETYLGLEVTIYIGNRTINSLIINNEQISEDKYYVKNYVLHIDSSVFALGDNEVKINDEIINVKILQNNTYQPVVEKDNTLLIVLLITIPSVLVVGGGVILTIILLKKKGNKAKCQK